jgi:hypothetical protein
MVKIEIHIETLDRYYKSEPIYITMNKNNINNNLIIIDDNNDNNKHSDKPIIIPPKIDRNYHHRPLHKYYHNLHHLQNITKWKDED